jgi:copper chaperone CopZ
MTMNKIKFNILGMHCTSCAFNIDGELEDTDGIKESKTNYASQTTEIVYDPIKITEKKMKSIIKKLGYDAEVTQ